MQFRFLVYGLLLAALIVAFNWANNLPGIPPVRIGGDTPLIPHNTEAGGRTNASSRERDNQRFRLDEGGGDSAVVPARLPLLNESDPWVREELQDLALPWLAETELVRTAATVLENASRGEVPRKFLQFLAPGGKFQVRRAGSRFQVNAQSYERYTPFVETLEQLEPGRAAKMFRMIEPLLGEAVTELGETGVSPRELAFDALGVALETPRVDAQAVLRQPKVMYTYADDDLESLKPLQKQLLRMGPQNLQRIRVWLEDFGLALAGETVDPEEARVVDEVMDEVLKPDLDGFETQPERESVLQ